MEPVAEPWQPHALHKVFSDLTTSLGWPQGRPLILAVDGRQGGGKTTIASRMAALVPASTIVHSDDVAWWESFFGWDHLMASGILEPLRRGEDVDYRPPAWEARGRGGSIVVPVSAPLVVVDGVGTSRRSLVPFIDAAVWVQSDFAEANRRGLARDGEEQSAIELWWEWDREEQPFLADDRPWERADVILCGTPDLTGVAFETETEVLVGRSLRP